MSLFHKNQSQSANQQAIDWQLELLRVQALMQQGQQNIGMGQPYSSGAYGAGGALQRVGLGYPTSAITVGGMVGSSVTYPQAALKLPEEIVVEALTGWRRWSVTMFGEELLSNNGTKWVPHVRLAAVCAMGSACQGPSCGCGIYAYKERQYAEKGDNAPTGITHIWGQVSLWGRVVEHKHGFRAQFAYPKAFINTGGIAERMAYVYGVKVIA